LGFIDPSYIDEDAKEENGEGDEVDIIGGIRITASSHSPNSRTVSSPAMLSVRRFIARTEGSPLMGLTGLATDAYNCLMAPRQSNVDPEHVPPVAAAAASVSALGNTDYYEEGDEVSRQLLLEGGGMGTDEFVEEANFDQYNEYGIVKSNINYDTDSDFADEEPPPDMSYYRETAVRRGRSLNPGGPERPDTDGMTEAAEDLALKEWKKARKKWNDANLAKKAKFKRFSDRNKR
jgi:hypothetical protein